MTPSSGSRTSLSARNRTGKPQVRQTPVTSGREGQAASPRRGVPSRTSASAARNRARLVRRRRRRRRRMLLTLLMLLIFAFVAYLGMRVVRRIRGGSFESLNQPYRVAREFTDTLNERENLRTVPFARDLCIVEGNVPLASSTLALDQAGLLLDLDNREVMFAQQAFNRTYPASITKIMTAIIALEYGNLEDVVTITQENITLEEGSQAVGFFAGDRATMEQLLNCLLVFSGNDAASAIAEHVGGTTAHFVELMNAKARALGMTGTHFTNPHGLTDEDHYTTPYDIYLMLQEAYKYPKFAEICQVATYTINFTRYDGSEASIALPSTDHYLTGEASAPRNVTILGGKTGTTSLAGNCLALITQNAFGKPFVSIVMGAGTKDVLYEEMNSLLQNIN